MATDFLLLRTRGSPACTPATYPNVRYTQFPRLSHGKDSQLPQGVVGAWAVRRRRSSESIETIGNAMVCVTGSLIAPRTSPDGIDDTCRMSSDAV